MLIVEISPPSREMTFVSYSITVIIQVPSSQTKALLNIHKGLSPKTKTKFWLLCCNIILGRKYNNNINNNVISSKGTMTTC